MTGTMTKALANVMRMSFDGDSQWHAPLLRMVETLDAEQALWRPTPERKCIWEIVRHINFWRLHLLARVKGRPVPDWRTNNWTLPEETTEVSWRAEVEALRAVHGEFAAWLEQCPSDELLAPGENGSPRQFESVMGIILHDSYHVGQIATLRALMGLPSVEA